MGNNRRTDRLNSLLKEVISEVIRKDLKHAAVSELTTVTQVDITKDLRHAKVYISIIGSEEEKRKTKEQLQTAAGFIAVHASKKIVIRYFPELTFLIDNTVEKQMHIDGLITKIQAEREARQEEYPDPES